LIAVGTGLWLFQQQASQNAQLQPDTPDRTTVEKAIAQAESMVSQLEAEAEKHESLGNCGTGCPAQC